MGLAHWFVLGVGERGLGVPGGGLGSRRKLRLGTDQEQECQGPTSSPQNPSKHGGNPGLLGSSGVSRGCLGRGCEGGGQHEQEETLTLSREIKA